jgi:hypothetical protein
MLTFQVDGAVRPSAETTRSMRHHRIVIFTKEDIIETKLIPEDPIERRSKLVKGAPSSDQAEVEIW